MAHERRFAKRDESDVYRGFKTSVIIQLTPGSEMTPGLIAPARKRSPKETSMMAGVAARTIVMPMTRIEQRLLLPLKKLKKGHTLGKRGCTQNPMFSRLLMWFQRSLECSPDLFSKIFRSTVFTNRSSHRVTEPMGKRRKSTCRDLMARVVIKGHMNTPRSQQTTGQ